MEYYKIYDITFLYADSLSNWEWRTQHCRASSVEECKRFYGLEKDDVKFEIIEVKEVKKNVPDEYL